MDLLSGESPRQWQLRQLAKRQQPAPTALAKPEPNREQQNANGELMRSNAAEIANLRELAAKHPAPKPVALAAPDAEPVALAEPDAEPSKPKGFAGKLRFANGIKAFGSKHEQKPE